MRTPKTTLIAALLFVAFAVPARPNVFPDFDSDKENFRPLPPSSSTTLNLGLGLSGHNSHFPNDTEDHDWSAAGFFQTRSARRVRGVIRFRVRDVDVIPGWELDRGFMSIEGTMLRPEEEAKLVEEERNRTLGTGRIDEDHNSDRTEEARMSGGVGPHPDGEGRKDMRSRSGQNMAMTKQRKKRKKNR